MSRHVLKVRKGEWLLQSAAGSTLGRMMIKLGRHDGFKTLNVVRRREAIAELKELGGDAVISTEDGPIDEQVRRIVGSQGVRHAIDPVGGETGTGILRSLAADGHLVVYGTLSGEPIGIDPRVMISGRLTVEGFWLGHWMREHSIPSLLLLFREIASADSQGRARLPDRRDLPTRSDRGRRPPRRDPRPQREGSRPDLTASSPPRLIPCKKSRDRRFISKFP